MRNLRHSRPYYFIFIASLFGLYLSALASDVKILENPDADRATVHARYPGAFDPVTENPALPRVLLIGDSISIGYTVSVRRLLRGKANVHRVPENVGSTTKGLAQVEQWLGDRDWDVIYFNFGLHDIKLDADGRTATSLCNYADNLRVLTARFKVSGARPIFATTTPVPHMLDDGPRRSNADVLVFNGKAREVMSELGVPVHDLYAYASARLSEIQRPSNVHFTDAGSKSLAKEVAKVIEKLLP